MKERVMPYTLMPLALAAALVTATGPAAGSDSFAEWNAMGEAAPEVAETDTQPVTAEAHAQTLHPAASTPWVTTAHLHADVAQAAKP